MDARPHPSSVEALQIRVLLREEEIAAEFAAAVERGFLDEKFFYWLPLSVQAWVDLCSAPEYRNTNRTLELLRTHAMDLARRWPMERLCGIGCGDGSKDELLLADFAAQGRHLAYVAADFSQSLVEMACRRALPIARRAEGVKLDVMRDEHLATLPKADGPTLYTILGNTLGAFGARQFPARLWRLMQANDRVLLDGELFAGPETLAGYDHPVNRRFAFGPLAALGLREPDDGWLVFELRSPGDGLHEVAKFFVPARDLELNVGGRKVALHAGKKLLMSGSIKYDEPAFFDALAHGGLRVDFSAKSADGRFVLAGARI